MGRTFFYRHPMIAQVLGCMGRTLIYEHLFNPVLGCMGRTLVHVHLFNPVDTYTNNNDYVSNDTQTEIRGHQWQYQRSMYDVQDAGYDIQAEICLDEKIII